MRKIFEFFNGWFFTICFISICLSALVILFAGVYNVFIEHSVVVVDGETFEDVSKIEVDRKYHEIKFWDHTAEC